MTTVTLTTLSFSSPAFTSPDCPSSSDYKYHRNDEVADLHDFVERRHLALEEIDEQRDNEAGDERCEKRPEMPSVKEVSRSLLLAVAGMRVAHSDNHTKPLPIVPER